MRLYRTPRSATPESTTLRVASAALAVAIVLTGCSGGAETVGDCEPMFSEPASDSSGIHVLAGSDATYLSDPPTSGPHVAWNAPAILDRQLTAPEQLGVLETGDVLVQYRPADVAEDTVAALATRLPDRAHLAPNADLPAPVVLTAHLTKQLCRSLDTEAIELFARERAGDPVG